MKRWSSEEVVLEMWCAHCGEERRKSIREKCGVFIMKNSLFKKEKVYSP